ncbi:MAG: hypothetical protein H7Y04_15350 [Verrucomicrobia bacterium]|nr:hypothetical protein [Cytophagales bacterium]
MLKKTFLLASFLVVTCFAKAQEIYVNKKESEVTIITAKGEKISGKTRYSFIADLQEEIVFYNKQNEMQVFRPFEIQGFVLEGKQFTSMEQKGLLMGLNHFFLHQQNAGSMKLYTLYFLENPGMTETQEYYVQKGNDKIYGVKSFRFINFRKEMSSFVSEVPELAKRIADKTYTASDIETIVDEYNGYLEASIETTSIGK